MKKMNTKLTVAVETYRVDWRTVELRAARKSVECRQLNT